MTIVLIVAFCFNFSSILVSAMEIPISDPLIKPNSIQDDFFKPNDKETQFKKKPEMRK